MKLNYLFIPLFALLFAACSSSGGTDDPEIVDPPTPTDPSNPDKPKVDSIELSFLSTVMNMTRNTSPELNSIQLERGMEMVISCRNISGIADTAVSTINNLLPSSTRYIADGNGGFRVYGGDSPLSFAAGSRIILYSYPFSSATGIKADQTTDEGFKESDYMIGLPEVGNPILVSRDPITMCYNHAMAKIVINLKVDDFADIYTHLISCSISDAYVNFIDPNTSNYASLQAKPEIRPWGNKTDILVCGDTLLENIQVNSNNNRYLKMSGIIVPCTYEEGSSFIKVTCGSNLGHTTYNFRLTETINFESGKVYTFNLSPRFVDVTASKVNNWTDGGIYDGDLTSD
ncbi:MAG: fimbrillin family protein [Bacteroidaceae bacterium]|nr:fimbrillin family protein [Bacteroidaceae bacterium]